MPTINRLTVEVTGAPTLSGKGVNVWHYSANNTATIANHQAVVTALNAYYTAAKPLYATGVTVTIATRVIQYGPPDTIIPVTQSAVTGSGTGGSEPAQLCATMAWRTLKAGPRYRGRTFMGPLCISATNTNGTLNTTVTTPIVTAAATLIGAVQGIGADWGLVVYSRKFKTSEFIVSGGTDNRVDILRSRG